MPRSCKLILFAIAFVFAAETISAADKLTQEQLIAARQKAADRQRRIILNNDGNEPAYLCKDTTPEELLKHRTTPLAGSQVDSLWYCTWSSGFSMFTHATKVGQVLSTTEGSFRGNLTPQMLAAGTDPLKVMADFGHKNKMEVFWSYRVNDTHDASTAEYGAIMFRANKLKNEHPEWLISTKDKKPKFGGWSAVDYAVPEIRDLSFKYIEEVCKNYDIDGIELDFFRHPVFFKRAAQAGDECNDSERAMMTDWMQRVRKMTEAVGRERGRPILIAVRAPDSVPYCRAVGLDIEKWMQKKLFDLYIPSGYFQLNPWETSVALGHKYGLKVYPSLDESRVKDPAALDLRTSPEAQRGRVLNVWQSGADGVYTYNAFRVKAKDTAQGIATAPLDTFEAAHQIWKELGSPELLKKLDRDHVASVRGLGNAAGGALPHAKFQNVPRLNPAVPEKVAAGQSVTVPIRIGSENSKDSAANGGAMLRLQFKDPPTSKLEVSLNGKPLANPKVNGSWLEFGLLDCTFKPGANEVKVTVPAGGTPVEWTDLHATIRVAK